MIASGFRRVRVVVRQWEMVAYMIARITVTDPVRYERYKALAPAAVEKFGGEYVARGGDTETLEGDEETNRLVVLRFPDMESARGMYHSTEYTAARAEREGAATGQFVIVEGV